MLKEAFDLLDNNPKYMNADILWVTDFQIPMVNYELIERINKTKSEQTRFYGIQIEMYEHPWGKYFDEIAIIGYTPIKMF